MNVSKITIGRLFNLGNYEHIRYELTVEVPDSGSASQAIVGLERILDGLKPLRGVKTDDELDQAQAEIERMQSMPFVEWQRQYGHCVGTPIEVIQRYKESLEKEICKRQKADERAARARAAFDDIGGASKWTDSKLEWESDYDDERF